MIPIPVLPPWAELICKELGVLLGYFGLAVILGLLGLSIFDGLQSVLNGKLQKIQPI